MNIPDLIARCAQNEVQAWRALCQLTESATLFPIRRMLTSRGFDLRLAEDVVQDLYLSLIEHALHPLLIFQGTSEPEFRVFLRTIAVRFALRTIKKWDASRRKERAARAKAVPMRAGPTEKDFREIASELKSLMIGGDWEKLGVISDFTDSLGGEPEAKHAAVPSRTIRRWRGELYRKYSSQIV